VVAGLEDEVKELEQWKLRAQDLEATLNDLQAKYAENTETRKAIQAAVMHLQPHNVNTRASVRDHVMEAQEKMHHDSPETLSRIRQYHKELMRLRLLSQQGGLDADREKEEQALEAKIKEELEQKCAEILSQLQFAPNDTAFLPESEAHLQQIALQCNQAPTVKLTLHGHTSNDGPPIWDLADGRLKTVADKLKAEGVRNEMVVKAWSNQHPTIGQQMLVRIIAGKEENEELDAFAKVQQMREEEGD
jgi:outer membrane protein OmpA-like peptidoglycan-associated protein